MAQVRLLGIPDSSNIRDVGYERGGGTRPETGLLFVRFKATPDFVYVYDNVREGTFLDILLAESVGGFFGQTVRKDAVAHPFSKVPYEGKD